MAIDIDIERALTAYLEPELEGVRRVCTDLTGIDFDEVDGGGVYVNLPLLLVEEAPGPGLTGESIDVCDVDLEAYARPAGDTTARDIAFGVLLQTRALILGLPRHGPITGTGVWISRSSTTRPVRLPYDNSDIRRYAITARLHAKKAPGSL